MRVTKRILAAVCAAGVVALVGCGDDVPDPSISRDGAETLIATLQEIEANVDNGSCLVAADKTQELQAEIEALPSDVNDEVRDALQRGALNLGGLVDDPSQCEREETTTQETTTEETTTETTTEETTTETQPTTTTPTAPTETGGGIGPPQGGGGGGGM
ncbi:MAG: hypothetical protein M3M99_06880 [Actinomycetota bacterium]|nr:hypothetical protein [Actinomycetota bacterium]